MNRQLRHTTGARERVGENARHAFALRHALAIHRAESIATFIPKNGSTSLRIAVATANGVAAGFDDATMVRSSPSPSYAQADLRDLARASFTFAIIRDPFERLSSAYLDKIVERRPEFWPFYRSVRTAALDHPEKLTFRRFVELMGKPRNRKANPHWRPQVDFLVYRRYDLLIPLERLEEHRQLLCERATLELLPGGLETNYRNTRFENVDGAFADAQPETIRSMRFNDGRSPAHTAMYDDEMRELARECYEEDVALYRAATEMSRANDGTV